jgi:rod shape-determining protein MreC
MLRRPHYLALSLVVLFVVVILNLPGRTATQCKLALSSLFLPLIGLASSTQSLTEKTSHRFYPRQALFDRIEQLQRENQQLRLREGQMAELWHENDRLREALQLQAQSPWNLKLARVILRDPANWWRTVHIDLGARDGVATNMAVLTSSGLVGRVHEVAYSSSQVAMIGDPHCGVSALVEEGASGDYGVISSSGANVLNASIVGLTFVNRQSAIKPGQRVVTSGLGGVFPKGILIGHIVDTNSVGFGLYTEARVKLAANLNNLQEVWVIFP